MTKKRINPSHPGEFLRRQVIEPYGLSVTNAAGILGVTRQTLSNLLNAKSSITPEMALRFEKAFGIKMDALLKMQMEYEIVQMRAKEHAINIKQYRQNKK